LMAAKPHCCYLFEKPNKKTATSTLLQERFLGICGGIQCC